jgi:hypothetical protein
MPAPRRALVVALACLSNFSLSCFAAAQLLDQVVRVTDSSPAADPVMGVNITLKTTLARVPENGMPVILGSSQAQVVSAQDGLASIVPSAGSVGPCEVFITVSAGQSPAQFQMESVAAIVSGPAPIKGHPITPSAPRGRQFGAQPVVSQSVPDMLFAVPQGDRGNEPAVDSNASASEISCGRPCHDRRGSPAASPESEDSVPPTPARSKPAKAKPKAQKKVVPAESDVAGIAPCTDAKGKVRIQSQPRQAPRFPRTNEVARC